MTVADIVREQDDRAAHTVEFVLWPRRWRSYQSTVNMTWQVHRLDESERAHVPDEPGIYTLLVQPNIAGHPACSYLMYVGRAASLRRRFGKYLTSERREAGRPKIFRLLHKYSDYIWFCFTTVAADVLDEAEDALIVAYGRPPCNDQVPAEVSKVEGAF